MFKTITLSIAGLVAIIALAFGLELGGLQWNKFFAPRRENIRRQVFEETKSYNQAKIQELVKYRLEYLKASDPAVKSAIASTIRHGFADYNTANLPYELKVFVDGIIY